MNIRNLTLTLLFLTLISCSKKSRDELDREILTTTKWLEVRTEADSSTRRYIYVFGSSGQLAIYILESDTDGRLDKTCRYIFNSDRELLAIESMGPFNVQEISTDILRLKPEGSTLPAMQLKRYSKPVSLN